MVGEHGHGAPTTFSQVAVLNSFAQPTGTSELVQRVGEQNVRSDDIVVPLENRELGGACR